MQIELTVNGEARRVQCEDNTLLVDLIRDDLGLTGRSRVHAADG